MEGRLIQTINGGCADIYVWTLSDGKQVAEKRPRFYTEDDLSKVAKRVARELRIWFQLQHPNILPLKGFVRRTDSVFPSIVTDWMGRGSLQQFLKNNVQVDAIYMARGVTKGLSYLHRQGVVHGDVKAANVVISRDCKPMLMDFGISHLLRGTGTVETATQAQKGTLRWLSPELLFQPEGQVDVDGEVHTKQSDIWALGMTWLELLTRDVPYAYLPLEHQVVGELYRKEIPRAPDGWESWTKSKKSLWGLCLLCWKIDATERPSVDSLVYEMTLIPEEDSVDEYQQKLLEVQRAILATGSNKKEPSRSVPPELSRKTQ